MSCDRSTILTGGSFVVSRGGWGPGWRGGLALLWKSTGEGHYERTTPHRCSVRSIFRRVCPSFEASRTSPGRPLSSLVDLVADEGVAMSPESPVADPAVLGLQLWDPGAAPAAGHLVAVTGPVPD